jgi:hypothetical protein
MNYWYYNGTGNAGRPFNSHWSDWYIIRNDTYVAVYERYASAASLYSVVDEWNVTIRVAFLKNDPVIRLDGWIRFVNPASLIKNFDCNPVYSELTDYSAWTYNVDSSRQMSYMLRNDGAVAWGAISCSLGYRGNGGSPADFSMVNRTQKRMTESFHFASLLVLGSSLNDLQNEADNVGSMWNHHEEKSSYNLIIAKNGDSFDALDYFSPTGYVVYPSGTTETIIAGGASATVAFLPNPIQNYAKIPVVTDVDDNQFAEGEDPLWDWLYATAREYGIAITLPSYFAETIHLDDIHSYINLSLERNGTLFEIADHGYNHTSFYAHQGYSYAYDTFLLSKAKWNGNTSIPLLSESLPANQYSYNTWDALGAAGVRNLRLSQAPAGWIPPMDYNLTGATIWVASFQCIHVSTQPGPSALVLLHSNGYYYLQGHGSDFDTPDEKAAVVAWWSWLQNQSAIISVTHSQWSDLEHHRIVYSVVNGKARVDLSTAQTNHRIYINATSGRMPIFWDLTDDEPALPSVLQESSCYFDAERGHVYEERLEASVQGSKIARLVNTTDDTIVSVNVTGAAGEITLHLAGLSGSKSYALQVDGKTVNSLVYAAPDGSLNWTYAGPWSSHVLTIAYSQVSQMLGVTYSLVGVVFAIGIISALIGTVASSSIGRRRG